MGEDGRRGRGTTEQRWRARRGTPSLAGVCPIRLQGRRREAQSRAFPVESDRQATVHNSVDLNYNGFPRLASTPGIVRHLSHFSPPSSQRSGGLVGLSPWGGGNLPLTHLAPPRSQQRRVSVWPRRLRPSAPAAATASAYPCRRPRPFPAAALSLRTRRQSSRRLPGSGCCPRRVASWRVAASRPAFRPPARPSATWCSRVAPPSPLPPVPPSVPRPWRLSSLVRACRCSHRRRRRRQHSPRFWAAPAASWRGSPPCRHAAAWRVAAWPRRRGRP